MHRTIVRDRRPPDAGTDAHAWGPTVQLSGRVGASWADRPPAPARGARVTLPRLARRPCARSSPLWPRGLLLLGAISRRRDRSRQATVPTMAARALLQGHVRQGGWFAIAVDLENDGSDRHRRAAGRAAAPDSRTRFGTPVELATGSRKDLPAVRAAAHVRGQPHRPARRRRPGDRRGARSRSRSTTSPSSWSASWRRTRPGSSAELKLLPGQTGCDPAIATAHSCRSARADPGLGATRPPRVAGRGHGVARRRPSSLSAGLGRGRRAAGDRRWHRRRRQPVRLPRRPAPVPPGRVCSTSIRRSWSRSLAACPRARRRSPPMPEPPGAGRVLATSGDRVIAAERSVGSGAVTLLGLRPGHLLARQRR